MTIEKLFKISGELVETHYDLTAPDNEFYHVVDLNEDGYDDIILVGAWYPPQETPFVTQPGTILFNDQNGGFTIATGDNLQTTHPRWIIVEDYNGDGLKDIFVADTGYDAPPNVGQKNSLLFNDGNGGFTDEGARLPDFLDFSHSTDAADIDLDGDMDLYVSNPFGEQFINSYFLINDGNGNFSVDVDRQPESMKLSNSGSEPPLLIDDQRKSLNVHFADLNGDGAEDMILGAFYPHGKSDPTIHWNDGKGNFTDENATVLVNDQPSWAVSEYDMKAVDYDLDGDLDLVTLSIPETGVSGWSVQLLTNEGNKIFSNETNIRITGRSFDINDEISTFLDIKDINRDGLIDIEILGYGFGNPIVHFLNTGNGFFEGISISQIKAETDDYFGHPSIFLQTPDRNQWTNILQTDDKKQYSLTYFESENTKVNINLNQFPAKTIVGTELDDTISGSTGNDTIDGGAGTDTALFSGIRADYTIAYADNGAVIVTDGTPLRDGTDTLTNVEIFKFTDQSIDAFPTFDELLGANSSQTKGISALYEILLGGVPNQAGFTFLINGNNATNFGAGPGPVFNDENIYINIANALVQGNATATTKFSTLAIGTTLVEQVTSLYQAIIPAASQSAEGLAYITSAANLTFYTAVAAERGITSDNGPSIISLASLLKIAVDGNIGIGNAVKDLLAAVSNGTAALPETSANVVPIETADGTGFDSDDAMPSASSAFALSAGLEETSLRVYEAVPVSLEDASADQLLAVIGVSSDADWIV